MAPAPSSSSTTWRGTRTRTSRVSWGSHPAHRNHNCSRLARSYAGCSRTLWTLHCRHRDRSMLHLDPERLAALADDEPTAAEVVHLAECVECAREREAHRALHTMAARERATVVQPPLSEWSSLRAQLVEDGLLASADDKRSDRVGARWRPWLNAAAAVLLVLGGGAVGRWSAYAGQRGA